MKQTGNLEIYGWDFSEFLKKLNSFSQEGFWQPIKKYAADKKR